MKPDDRFAVRMNGREISETLAKPGYVFALSHCVQGKPGQKNYEAERQKEAIECVHSLEHKL
jgi:hypothetical protein